MTDTPSSSNTADKNESTETRSALGDTTTRIEIGTIAAPKGPRSLRPDTAASEPASSRQWLVRHAPLVVAAGIAAPALVIPLGWLAATTVSAFVVLCAFEGRRDRSGRLASSDLLVVPLHGAGRGTRRVLRAAVNLPRGLVELIKILAVAIVVPAAFGAIPWLVTRGTEGMLAAARLAVLAHGPRLVAFLLCWHLVRGSGNLREARERGVRQRLERWSDLAVTGLWVAVAAVLAYAGLAADVRGWAPFATAQNVVELLPDGLADNVVDAQESYATDTSVSVVKCLGEHGAGSWAVLPVQVADNGTWTVVVGANGVQPADIAAAATALHNQLPVYASNLLLATDVPGGEQWQIDRTGLRHDVPLTPKAVLDGSSPPEALRDVTITDEQVSTSLTCSAVHL